jgi:hypothetical protein
MMDVKNMQEPDECRQDLYVTKVVERQKVKIIHNLILFSLEYVKYNRIHEKRGMKCNYTLFCYIYIPCINYI